MTRIIALDLSSTRIGISVNGALSSHPFHPKDSLVAKMVEWRAMLPNLVRKADLVVYEECFHRGPAGARAFFSLAMLTHLACHDAGVPCDCVNVSTVKKFATGKGNAKKYEMIAAAEEAGANPQNDDEADAYWIGRWARENLK